MNKTILIVVIIVLVGIGIWYGTRDKASIDREPTATTTPPVVLPPVATTTPTATSTAGIVKSFTVTASSDFKFSPTEIKVKQGDTVKITLKNSGGNHDWNLDEFKASTKILKTGESETITFVASKKGTFEYYCSVGNHRQMGMKGNLIVE